MVHPIFKADYQLMIAWLKAKGYSGGLNEMFIQYFKSLIGGSQNGYLNDLVAIQMRSLGFSGSVGDMLNSFFYQRTGIVNAVDAQREFFRDSSNNFSNASIALISSTQVGSTNGTSVTTSGIDTTGATIIVINAVTLGGGTPTDSKSNTWTALTAQTAPVSTNRSQLFYAVNPTVGTAHTFSLTATVPALSVLAFSGVVTSLPFDVQNGAAADTVTTLSTGSVTPSEDNEVVVSGLSIGGSLASDYVIDNGFTATTYIPVVGGQHFGSGIAYKIQTTAAAVNPAWSGTSASFACTIASFKSG